jgi:UDP-glucose 4-epimerase
MRIFATGATGFLGNNVLRYLLKEKDAEVFALRRKNRPFIKKFPREPNWIEGSLEGDYSKVLADCDVFLHMAAYGVRDQNNWDACFEVNVRDSLNIWRQALASNLNRFVIIGSCFEYGAAAGKYDAIPPNAPLLPTQAYHSSKAAATMAAIGLGYAEKSMVSILRPFHLYGPDEPEGRFYPELVRAARAGKDFSMTWGEQIRDFTPVEYAAGVITEHVKKICDEKSWRAPVIKNVGTGNPRSLIEFAEGLWQKESTGGRLKCGEIQYRPQEVMKYVPEI